MLGYVGETLFSLWAISKLRLLVSWNYSVMPESLKPCANGRNIVGQQLPTLLDATCYVRLHTLLDVVAQSLKPVKLFSQLLPTFLLFRDRRSVAQQCWIRLHSSSNILGDVASVCTPLPTRTQQLPTLLAQQCWELLRPFTRSLMEKKISCS